MTKAIPGPVLKRLPLYYKYLRQLPIGETHISGAKIANDLELNPVLVRKDLAATGAVGKPKVGHETAALAALLENFLGYCSTSQAALAGAGKLGRALMDYKGFSAYGIEITVAFDTDETLWDAQKILPLSKMEGLCKRMGIKIGIITVPAEHAQSVCDLMVKSGIIAIWNFAPVNLKTRSDVFIHNENLSSSLVLLSNFVNRKTINYQKHMKREEIGHGC